MAAVQCNIVNDSLVPVVFDLWHGDKHDFNDFTDTVVEFAEAGGAFVYPIVTKRGIFVVSPRSLDLPESQEVYTKDQIEQVKSLIEDGLTPDDIMAGFLTCQGDTLYYSLTPDEIEGIANELGQAHTPGSAADTEVRAMRQPSPEIRETTKRHTISTSSKRIVGSAAVNAMTALRARRADWLLYLRLLRLVTDEIADPELSGEMIGVVLHGQPLQPLDLFPSWTDGQLQYRMRKLVAADVVIRKRTAEGYRLAIRFCSASAHKTTPEVSMEHFGWLRRPVQLLLPFATEQPRKSVQPAVLPMAA